MIFLKEIKADIRQVKADKKDLRNFGLVVGGIIFVLAFLLENFFFLVLSIGVSLILLGSFYPKILFYPYKFWMSLAVVLGFFISRFLLVILFFCVILPIGLFIQLFKGDFLNKDFSRKEKTYWKKRIKTKFSKEDFEEF